MDAEDRIDDLLKNSEFEGFTIFDDSASNEDLFYLTGFEASDPFFYLYSDDGSTIVLPQLEYSRAGDEANVENVYSSSEYTTGESRDDESKKVRMIEKVLEEKDAERIVVPEDFSLKLADDLRTRGIEIRASDENPVMEARKIKDEGEVQKLKEIQELTEEAMKLAREIIASSKVQEGVLHYEGEILSSERLKREIKKFLIEKGCDVPHENIVASGRESAKPHATGEGEIKAGELIVIDIFPRKNRYFGDMTRTFVKGEVPEEARKMVEAVKDALDAAYEVLRKGAGVKAEGVHNRVCDVLEEHGYETLRDNETESGFLHSTGHAVGLELHEPPRIAGNDDELEAGMVLTIEPGLYLPEIGGVRLEDMIVIREDGFENFNSMSKRVQLN